MFQFLFKYPHAVYARGQIVLLAPWPLWLLWLAIAVAAALLAGLIAWYLPRGSSPSVRRRGALIWLMQSLLVALLLTLLWQPALTVTELKPQQNIVAFLLDDSRSMGIVEDGASREAQAIAALQGGALAGVGKRFQIRLYRFDSAIARLDGLGSLQPAAPATHISASLRQLAAETAGLPLGAVVLLSDGSDNGNGVDPDTLAALRDRHIPVHTVGFGHTKAVQDVELDDVQLAARALADSRLAAVVRFHQHGYAGRQLRLLVREGNQVLAAQDLRLAADGTAQSQSLLFNVGAAGVKALRFALELQPGEENAANNELTRLLNVDADQRSVLYVEGEPRWEYKFIRRAAGDDRMLRLVSMLRTSENKIYRQNVQNGQELAAGFPTRARDLFVYQGLVIGSVEANYFSPAQRELIRQFVDRRGGGLLLLGGRYALADGGWGASSLADLLPTVLPEAKNTFHVDPAGVQLTSAGADSPLTRLLDDPAANVQRWKKLPTLMDYQEAGVPKPGAVVLATLQAQGRSLPLLVTESYGRGRTAELATSGTWRWQMNLPVGDPSFDLYWQQLLRWLVTDSHGPVVAAVEQPQLQDDGQQVLSADVRDADFMPVADAQVQAHILGPGALAASVAMTPVPGAPGRYAAPWYAGQPGDYLTELSASRHDGPLGRDVVYFRRVDGVAENFHTQQNRELLERIAALTGGRYWRPQELAHLSDEIDLSAAGVSATGTRALWNLPVVFLLLLALPATEWLLRRRWGLV